jgi:hypothetical protein
MEQPIPPHVLGYQTPARPACRLSPDAGIARQGLVARFVLFAAWSLAFAVSPFPLVTVFGNAVGTRTQQWDLCQLIMDVLTPMGDFGVAFGKIVVAVSLGSFLFSPLIMLGIAKSRGSGLRLFGALPPIFLIGVQYYFSEISNWRDAGPLALLEVAFALSTVALMLQPHGDQGRLVVPVQNSGAFFTFTLPLGLAGGALFGFGVAGWFGSVAGAYSYPKDQDIGLGLEVLAVGAVTVIAGAVLGSIAAWRISSRDGYH